MAISLSQAASRMQTNAAAVATAMAGGTVTADMQALASVLLVMSQIPQEAIPLIMRANTSVVLPQ